jgi:hypothetical protein
MAILSIIVFINLAAEVGMKSVKSHACTHKHTLFISLSDFVFSVPADGTVVDNVTVGERLGIPWPSDNAEHFEARNHTCYCTATGGPDPMCYGNRLESSSQNM